MTEIWAILEQNSAGLEEHSGELLADVAEIASKLSIEKQPATLCAVLLTSPDVALPDLSLLTQQGFSRLYMLEHRLLAHYSTEVHVQAMAWLIKERQPLLVATHATANGRDWMPRLAARLCLPFVPGCLGIELHDDALLALRAIYDGRAYAQTRTGLGGRTGLVTLIQGTRGTPGPVRKAEQKDHAQAAKMTILRLVPEISAFSATGSITQIKIEAPVPEQVELDMAERIVAGGRGVGQEGFTVIAQFAQLLGAAVGATRVATDRGWVEQARQIGATGKSVHPRLYIACGISGAAQHASGMREAQTVVAINPDRTAPIFALADLGLLGDANRVLPMAGKLIEKINQKGC
jgi:electron transfer flavoprotein alpha subunit